MNLERQIKIERRFKKRINQELEDINSREINELNFDNSTSWALISIKSFENIKVDINTKQKKVIRFLNKKPTYINSTGSYWIIYNKLYRLSTYWGYYIGKWGGQALNGNGPRVLGCTWFLKEYIKETDGPHYRPKMIVCSLGMITFDELTKQSKKIVCFIIKSSHIL